MSFMRDYAHVVTKYAENVVYPKEVHQIPSLEMLLTFAEKEFEKEFSQPPTHAVYAPAHINLSGNLEFISTDFNDAKVLSMTTQLVTVIVGTRRATIRRCKVKTLSREIEEENYSEFAISSVGLDTNNGLKWVNYVKAVICGFSIPREYIPGFKALIISSIPIKRGLGSSSALTVAIYTFLEAITKVHTSNNLEKSIACQQAEKTFMQVPCSLGATLFSVVGVEGQVTEFDPRTLQLDKHNWNARDIDLILISSTQEANNTFFYKKHLNQCREVAIAVNLTSLRDVTISKLSSVEPLFSAKLIERVHYLISETSRVTTAVKLIKQCRWKQLGKAMWETHCFMRDNFGSSCIQIEHITKAIQNIHGVYGAKIIGRGYGGFVLVMVHRKAIKDMVKVLRHVTECEEYQVIRPSSGARILYTDKSKRPVRILTNKKCAKKPSAHHLVFGDYESYELHHDTIYGVSHDKAFTRLKVISRKT